MSETKYRFPMESSKKIAFMKDIAAVKDGRKSFKVKVVTKTGSFLEFTFTDVKTEPEEK